MVVFPDVLNRLASDVQWTTALGNAFLAQQADVMHAVQNLRSEARASGKLNSCPQQTVTTQTQNGQSAIDIIPAIPQDVYVPRYDPDDVWGQPPYGYYPPLYSPPVDYGLGFFLSGIFLGGFFGGLGWGLGSGGWVRAAIGSAVFFSPTDYSSTTTDSVAGAADSAAASLPVPADTVAAHGRISGISRWCSVRKWSGREPFWWNIRPKWKLRSGRTDLAQTNWFVRGSGTARGAAGGRFGSAGGIPVIC